MAKSQTTDLPGADLLFGNHSKAADEMKTAVKQKEEPEAVVKSKDESTEPVKFTFYFDPEVLEDLEVAKFRLRMERRVRVSKSDIVNASLKHCMKDLVFLERLVGSQIN